MYTEQEIDQILAYHILQERLAYANSLQDTLPENEPMIQDLFILARYVTDTILPGDSDIIDEYMEHVFNQDAVKLTLGEWHNLCLIDNTLRQMLINYYGSNENIELDFTYAATCMHFYLISGFLVPYIVNNKTLIDLPIDKHILDGIVLFIKNVNSN